MMEIIQSIDTSLLRFVHTELGSTFLDVLCPILRNKYTWIPLYIGISVYFWRTHPKDFWRIILCASVCTAFSDILCAQVLKPFFQRIRPCHVAEFSVWIRSFSHCSSTFSFPSCHAMNHGALAAFLFPHFSKKYSWLCILWVLSIGFSQIYVGVHYPLDVFAGALIGGIIGYSIYYSILLKSKT